MKSWLLATVWGVPHWTMIVMAAFAIMERVLSRSKNPQARSIVAALALCMRWFFTLTRISMIPIVGPRLVRVVEMIAGVDIDGDGRVGDDAAGNDDVTVPGIKPVQNDGGPVFPDAKP